MIFLYNNLIIFILFFASGCHTYPTDDVVPVCDLPRTPYKENARMLVQGLDHVLRSSNYNTLQKVTQNPSGFLDHVLQTTREHAKEKQAQERMRYQIRRLLHPTHTKKIISDLETMDRKTIWNLLSMQAIELGDLDRTKELDDLFWTKYYMRESLERLPKETPGAVNFCKAFEQFRKDRAQAAGAEPKAFSSSLPAQFTLVAYTATLLKQEGQLETIRDKL